MEYISILCVFHSIFLIFYTHLLYTNERERKRRKFMFFFFCVFVSSTAKEEECVGGNISMVCVVGNICLHLKKNTPLDAECEGRGVKRRKTHFSTRSKTRSGSVVESNDDSSIAVFPNWNTGRPLLNFFLREFFFFSRGGLSLRPSHP